MRCGLYDESYKIAADTNLLVNYLYNCHLKVAYLPEFVTRMRMGGMRLLGVGVDSEGQDVHGLPSHLASTR